MLGPAALSLLLSALCGSSGPALMQSSRGLGQCSADGLSSGPAGVSIQCAASGRHHWGLPPPCVGAGAPLSAARGTSRPLRGERQGSKIHNQAAMRAINSLINSSNSLFSLVLTRSLAGRTLRAIFRFVRSFHASRPLGRPSIFLGGGRDVVPSGGRRYSIETPSSPANWPPKRRPRDHDFF